MVYILGRVWAVQFTGFACTDWSIAGAGIVNGWRAKWLVLQIVYMFTIFINLC